MACLLSWRPIEYVHCDRPSEKLPQPKSSMPTLVRHEVELWLAAADVCLPCVGPHKKHSGEFCGLGGRRAVVWLRPW
jgi:hypothetical protein